MDAIRVILADDSKLIRQVLRRLLSKETDIEIVAEAANGLEALKAVQVHRPHILLLDISMPVMNGIEVLDRLKKTKAKVRTLVVSGLGEQQYIDHVFLLGADGYIVKDEVLGCLAQAIRKIFRGNSLVVSSCEAAELTMMKKRRSSHVLVFNNQPPTKQNPT